MEIIHRDSSLYIETQYLIIHLNQSNIKPNPENKKKSKKKKRKRKLKPCKRSQRHRGPEARLERDVVRHDALEVDAADVPLQPVQRESIPS